MVYYKVHAKYDNEQLYTENSPHRYVGFLIGNELYTRKEFDKLLNRCGIIILPMFVPVEVPKNKIFFSFGARFEQGAIEW